MLYIRAYATQLYIYIFTYWDYKKPLYLDPYETTWEVFFSMVHVNRESHPIHCSTGEKSHPKQWTFMRGTLLT